MMGSSTADFQPVEPSEWEFRGLWGPHGIGDSLHSTQGGKKGHCVQDRLLIYFVLIEMSDKRIEEIRKHIDVLKQTSSQLVTQARL